MDRVTKFRAWHKDSELMFNVLAIAFQNKQIVVKWHGVERAIKADQFNLMQSIEQTDKNGVTIYEGDVCTKMISPDENNLAPKELHRGVIEFHYGGFCYKSGDYYYPMSRTHGVVEVIGNVYQNPELLK